jgi:hypothetical protein
MGESGARTPRMFRSLLLLPTQHGGFGLLPPSLRTGPSLQASRTSTKHLVDVLNGRESRLDLQLVHKELGRDGRTELAAKIDAQCISRREVIEARLSPDLLRALSRLDMSWIPEKVRPKSSWLYI